MIIVKEISGRLYVADIGPATSPTSPGPILQDWTPIGPGTNPTVSWDGTTYYIAFEYLGHVYVRKMDSTIWPPEIIDPTTYTPNISIEEPHDALAFGARGSRLGRIFATDDGYNTKAHLGYLERTNGLLYDLDTGLFSTDMQRHVAQIPTPATFQAWRVYKRTPASGNTPAGPWELYADWQSEVGLFTLSGIGELNLELALTFGRLWDAAGVNTNLTTTKLYYESIPGQTIRVNSNTEPKTFQVPIADTIQASKGDGSISGVIFSASQEFFSVPVEDTWNVPMTQQFGGVLFDSPRSSTFVAANYTDPGGLSDSLNLSQGQVLGGLVIYT